MVGLLPFSGKVRVPAIDLVAQQSGALQIGGRFSSILSHQI
jgi:hypothetical protein